MICVVACLACLRFSGHLSLKLSKKKWLMTFWSSFSLYCSLKGIDSKCVIDFYSAFMIGQMLDSGQTIDDILLGCGSMLFGAIFQNLLNCRRLKASEIQFSVVLTYLAKTRLLLIRLFKVINLNKVMHLPQEEAKLLIMLTTAVLSQNSTILIFQSSSPHISSAAVNANSSKYSMDGLLFLMNPFSHCAKSQ